MTAKALLGLGVILCLSLAAANAADPPATGKKVAEFQPLDAALVKFMDKIGCQAATVAVSVNGNTVYSRGFGWADEAKKKPVAPDALMRVASVSKPITAAAVKNAVRANQLALDAKAFELVPVKLPAGKKADPQLRQITVEHLLQHKGGWDRDMSGDVMFRAAEVERELGLTKPATPADMVAYMAAKPLDFAPGEKTVYSNFGYCVLGRVLEKTHKKPYAECVQLSVCKPLGIKDIKLGFAAPAKRDPREVWYPVAPDAFPLDVMDAHGGLIASAPALCQFMQAYWISGDPRPPGKGQNWTFFGSMPGTTAMVRQRADGVDVAVLLNGRRDKTYLQDNEELQKSVDAILDEIGKGK